jgi:Tfp pilus assembly protein PilV
MRASTHVRRGITVLEVLIAIGILAIGLASVAAIIPAAGSQSQRAVILDRGAVLAANVLADAATFGLLRQSGTDWTGLTVTSTSVILDLANTTLLSTSTAALRDAGMFSTATSGTAASAAKRLILESRDDVIVKAPATDDDPPTNQVVDGARGYEGRMTALLCLSGTGAGPYRASAVVFHGRDPGTLSITGTVVSGTMTVATSELAGRQLGDLIRPGIVANVSGTFHQLNAAIVQPMADSTATTTATVFLSSAKDPALGTSGTIQFLPDSVGLAERIFWPETAGGFAP